MSTPYEEEATLGKIQKVIAKAAKDPARAAAHARRANALIEQLRSGDIAGPVACQRIIVVPGIAAVANGGASTTAYPVKFPQRARVVRMVAGLLADASQANLSDVAIRVSIAGGQAELFTNGTAAAFGNLLSLGIAPAAGAGFGQGIPLDVPVQADETWQVYFTNNGAANRTPWVHFLTARP